MLLTKVFTTFIMVAVLSRKADAESEANQEVTRSQAKRDVKIVGGNDVRNKYYMRKKLPWMALLHLVKGNHFCGGTLITKKHVLTAAHCNQERYLGKKVFLQRLRVRLGAYKLDDPDLRRDKSVHDYKVCSFEMHEDYNPTTVINDIAILTLKRNVNDEFVPIRIPSRDEGDIYFVHQAKVIGWGNMRNGKRSKKPKTIDINVFETDYCKTKYENTSYNEKESITDKVLCAGTKDGSKDSCSGDSGGPLVMKYQYANGTISTARWRKNPNFDRRPNTLIGVVSWGHFECGKEGFPGLYTRVDKYLDWIEEQKSIQKDVVQYGGKFLCGFEFEECHEAHKASSRNTGIIKERIYKISG